MFGAFVGDKLVISTLGVTSFPSQSQALPAGKRISYRPHPGKSAPFPLIFLASSGVGVSKSPMETGRFPATGAPALRAQFQSHRTPQNNSQLQLF